MIIRKLISNNEQSVATIIINKAVTIFNLSDIMKKDVCCRQNLIPPKPRIPLKSAERAEAAESRNKSVLIKLIYSASAPTSSTTTADSIQDIPCMIIIITASHVSCSVGYTSISITRRDQYHDYCLD